MSDQNEERRAVWIDCDPGHDDALALLLAFFGTAEPSSERRSDLHVLGVSTTHGNATGRHTYVNAVRLLSAYGIGPDRCRIWRGSDAPLLRIKKQDQGIHGDDGLAGVECLPTIDDALVKRHFGQGSGQADVLTLVRHQIDVLQERRRRRLPPITIVATGPLTNVALLMKMCPGSDDDDDDDEMTLLRQTVAQVVLMGGAAATSGNRSPTAEWNVMVDPEAASIVFDSPIPVVMAGLNVTHQAIFTPALQAKLTNVIAPISSLRQLVSSAITFFASTYQSVFDFQRGPPIHDMLAVAYVLDPSLFYALRPRQHAPITDSAADVPQKVPCRRFRVHVDTSHGLTAGTTIVDFYEQWPVLHDGWAKGGRNAVVLEYVETDRLWPLLFTAVQRAESFLSTPQNNSHDHQNAKATLYS